MVRVIDERTVADAPAAATTVAAEAIHWVQNNTRLESTSIKLLLPIPYELVTNC
jgi:hypothetical protein